MSLRRALKGHPGYSLREELVRVLCAVGNGIIRVQAAVLSVPLILAALWGVDLMVRALHG